MKIAYSDFLSHNLAAGIISQLQTRRRNPLADVDQHFS